MKAKVRSQEFEVKLKEKNWKIPSNCFEVGNPNCSCWFWQRTVQIVLKAPRNVVGIDAKRFSKRFSSLRKSCSSRRLCCNSRPSITTIASSPDERQCAFYLAQPSNLKEEHQWFMKRFHDLRLSIVCGPRHCELPTASCYELPTTSCSRPSGQEELQLKFSARLLNFFFTKIQKKRSFKRKWKKSSLKVVGELF